MMMNEAAVLDADVWTDCRCGERAAESAGRCRICQQDWHNPPAPRLVICAACQREVSTLLAWPEGGCFICQPDAGRANPYVGTPAQEGHAPADPLCNCIYCH